MTEQEWFSCTSAYKMINFLLSLNKYSDRKFRLLACAACRQIWDLLSPKNRTTVELTEVYADEITRDALRELFFSDSPPNFSKDQPGVAAWCCTWMPNIGIGAERAITHACVSRRVKCETSSCNTPEQIKLIHCIFGNPFKR